MMSNKTTAAIAVAASIGLMLAGAHVRAEDAPKPSDDKTGTGSGWSAEVAPSDSTGIALDEKQTEQVNKISAYFNELGSLKGSFVQTGADNKALKGKFYLKRPGRFRFDYALPSKQIVISDGEYLAIQDLDLNNEDRISLDDTPFRLLLRKDVDLVRDARIMEVQEAEDLIGRIRGMMAGEVEPDEDSFGELVALKGVVKYPVRIKCAVLPWDVLQEALEGEGSAAAASPH